MTYISKKQRKSTYNIDTLIVCLVCVCVCVCVCGR